MGSCWQIGAPSPIRSQEPWVPVMGSCVPGGVRNVVNYLYSLEPLHLGQGGRLLFLILVIYTNRSDSCDIVKVCVTKLLEGMRVCMSHLGLSFLNSSIPLPRLVQRAAGGPGP